jgi:hypothetical protein
MKRLIGRTDVEVALKKLDRLTSEEARMAAAQNLETTMNTVVAVDNTAAGVDDRVVEVDNRKVAEVIDGA